MPSRARVFYIRNTPALKEPPSLQDWGIKLEVQGAETSHGWYSQAESWGSRTPGYGQQISLGNHKKAVATGSSTNEALSSSCPPLTVGDPWSPLRSQGVKRVQNNTLDDIVIQPLPTPPLTQSCL